MNLNLKRDAKIDYLRVLTMLLIIMHHCVVNDFGLQPILKGQQDQKYSMLSFVIMAGINSLAVVGVNVFFMLSGWCRINFKWKKLFLLVAKVYFVFTIIQAFGLFTGNINLSLQEIKKLIDPLDLYWFIMTYVFLMFASVLLNKIIESWSKSDFIKYIIAFFVICCIYGFVADRTLHINRGYSFLMAMALYLLGGGLRKYGLEILADVRKNFRFYLWFVLIFCVLINTIFVTAFYSMNLGIISWQFYAYNCPLIVIESTILMLLMASGKEVKSNAVSYFAKATIMAYMLHSTSWLTTIRAMGTHALIEKCGDLGALIILVLYALFIYSLAVIVEIVYEKTVGRLVGWVYQLIADKYTNRTINK